MSSELTRLDWVLIALILLITAFHAAMLGGVFRGEHAAEAQAPFDRSAVPSGNAPGIELSQAMQAEADASPDLPGRYVPTQGKQHTRVWPLDERVPYCVDGAIRNDCYASMPPSSGLHVPVQRAARLADGTVTPLPPGPGVYAFDLLVIQELSLRRRVVMARFSDLPPDTIGMASWTRVDTFAASDFDAERVSAFIRAHSCRYDPEGFCGEDPPES
jgi:hypothetical protein